MLDRTKIVKALNECSGSFLSALNNEQQAARIVWEYIAHDTDLCERLAPHRARHILPSWHGPVGQKTTLSKQDLYTVVSVDGSQVYPDRHQGIDCFLINIGSVKLEYGEVASAVEFDSTPFVHLGGENADRECTPEFVNAQRTYQELTTGLELMGKLASKKNSQALFLFDGSLIFWHLKQPKTPEEYALLESYMGVVESFFEKSYCIAGYISKPGGKELVNIIKSAVRLHPHLLEKFSGVNDFTHSTDTDIAGLYLEPGERSGLFCSQASVAAYYPEHSKPYFFYINTGHEIARIEIPAWIALQTRYLDFIAHAIYDQALKGNSYPVSLAEAHEQAVISHAERSFFYHLLSLMANKNNYSYMLSQKSSKKARPPV